MVRNKFEGMSKEDLESYISKYSGGNPYAEERIRAEYDFANMDESPEVGAIIKPMECKEVFDIRVETIALELMKRFSKPMEKLAK
jgi:hypothetical protein